MSNREEVLEFGEQILSAKDLDPVYEYLMSYEERYLKQWLLTYSMFYHCGVATALAKMPREEYWRTVSEGVKPGINSFPRGEERRHFRGQVAIKAVESMSEYAPSGIVNSWYTWPTFEGVKKNVEKYPLYGPWIAFKLADIGERVLRYPIDFSNCSLGFYKEPRQGAALMVYDDEHHPMTPLEIEVAVNYICNNLNAKGFMAPPWNDRPLNIQEAETILCKWKSHKHGHYPIGKDVAAVEKALQWKLPSTLSI